MRILIDGCTLTFRSLKSFLSRIIPNKATKRRIMIWTLTRWKTTNRLKSTPRKSRKSTKNSSVRRLDGLCQLINTRKDPIIRTQMTKSHPFVRISFMMVSTLTVNKIRGITHLERILICWDSDRLMIDTFLLRTRFKSSIVRKITNHKTDYLSIHYFFLLNIESICKEMKISNFAQFNLNCQG